ncbi:Uncharacterised protein [uncultured archaeon]|nr:Uncharacterised protein [uncultured archaeon]
MGIKIKKLTFYISFLLFFLVTISAYSYGQGTYGADCYTSGCSASSPVNPENTPGVSLSSPSSSGGGCLTNWTCSSWTSCINEFQTRECIKEKPSCYADIKKKPSEIQNCSIPESNQSNETASEGNNPPKINLNKDNQSLITGVIIFLVLILFTVLIIYKIHRRRRYLRHGY